MKPINLKNSIKAGLARDYFDGVRAWSKKSLEGIINPLGYHNTLQDTEIINMIKEIEDEGLIRIIGDDELYLEILKAPANS